MRSRAADKPRATGDTPAWPTVAFSPRRIDASRGCAPVTAPAYPTVAGYSYDNAFITADEPGTVREQGYESSTSCECSYSYEYGLRVPHCTRAVTRIRIYTACTSPRDDSMVQVTVRHAAPAKPAGHHCPPLFVSSICLHYCLSFLSWDFTSQSGSQQQEVV